MTETTKNRSSVEIHKRSAETDDEAVSRTLTSPEVSAALTIQASAGACNHEINALIRELTAQSASVNRGDLSRGESMLIAQAHTLDELFHFMTRRALSNFRGGYGDAADRYMRLALKAQGQARTTLETLAEVKNPRTVAFVRQANIAHGHQQVNNGETDSRTNTRGRAQARKTETQQNKLLEAGAHGERLDTGTAGTTSGINPELATVGTIHGASDRPR